MEKSAARAKYQQASALFARGNHAAALVLLDELLEAFPGSTNLVCARERVLSAMQHSKAAKGASAEREFPRKRTAILVAGAAVCAFVLGAGAVWGFTHAENHAGDIHVQVLSKNLAGPAAGPAQTHSPNSKTPQPVRSTPGAPKSSPNVQLSPVEQSRNEPPSNDFRPLSVTAAVLDESGSAMPEMHVSAVSREYGWRLEEQTDGNGEATLELLPGAWDLFAVPTHAGLWSHAGKGYLLARLDVPISHSSRIVLEPDLIVDVSLASNVFDFSERENYVCFVVEPYGKFLRARASGVTKTASLQLHTQRGLTARSSVASPRTSGETLYFIQDARRLQSPFSFEVNSNNSCVLAFHAVNALDRPTDFHVQLQSCALTWPWSPWIRDLPPTSNTVRVSPHEFFLRQAVDAYDGSGIRYRLSLNPRVIAPKAGETVKLSMGGPLKVSAVRVTPRAARDFSPATQLMMWVQDAFGNSVKEVEKARTGRLDPVVTIRQGDATRRASEIGLFFTAKLLSEFERDLNATYDISYDWGPWGHGTVAGNLYGREERRIDIHETPLLLSQAPRLDTARRALKVADYEAFAQAMQSIMGVPTDYKMGVISNIMHAGFEDEVQHGYKLETGIELDRPAGWIAGDGFLDHEAGHGRLHKPPCRFFAVDVFAESYATLIGCKARSVLFGGEEYLKFLLGRHDFFLRHRHGTPVAGDSDRVEAMQFITLYIDTHFGWGPHRRMILEWNNSFRHLKEFLQTAGYSPLEQFAIIYSWLCDANLGPVFAASGLDVTATRVEEGTSELEACLNKSGETKLRIGTNTVEAAWTSVPVELIAPSSARCTQFTFDLIYDSSKLALDAVYRRDLTDSPHWTLTLSSREIGPGKIHIKLAGSQPVGAVGALCQLNFRLLPNAQGKLAFSLSDVEVDGTATSHEDGALDIPDKPVFGSFPNLPAARLGAEYAARLWAVGGAPPYTWSVVEDAPPPGVTLDPASGQLSGKASVEEERVFRVRVVDSQGRDAHRWFRLPVAR